MVPALLVALPLEELPEPQPTRASARHATAANAASALHVRFFVILLPFSSVVVCASTPERQASRLCAAPLSTYGWVPLYVHFRYKLFNKCTDRRTTPTRSVEYGFY